MSSQVFPKKNAAFTFYVSLTSQASPNNFQASATLAAGDVKVAIDNGSFNNLTTLPVVTPAGSKTIKVDLSADEMNGDNIQVLFSDAAGAEWADLMVNIQTTARQVDDLAYPTVSGRSLDVSAGGEAGVDWGNVGNKTTTNDLSGTSVGTASALGTQAKADVNAEVVDVMTVDVVADSVAADGSRPTLAQAAYMLVQFLMERSVSGTTMTVKKPDGSTTLMTFTLNDASNPTSLTRS